MDTEYAERLELHVAINGMDHKVKDANSYIAAMRPAAPHGLYADHFILAVACEFLSQRMEIELAFSNKLKSACNFFRVSFPVVFGEIRL